MAVAVAVAVAVAATVTVAEYGVTGRTHNDNDCSAIILLSITSRLFPISPPPPTPTPSRVKAPYLAAAAVDMAPGSQPSDDVIRSARPSIGDRRRGLSVDPLSVARTAPRQAVPTDTGYRADSRYRAVGLSENRERRRTVGLATPASEGNNRNGDGTYEPLQTRPRRISPPR